MSFALTTAQIMEGTKTVTRRLGWLHAKPGQLLRPVRKGMGLRPGERIDVLRDPIRLAMSLLGTVLAEEHETPELRRRLEWERAKGLGAHGHREDRHAHELGALVESEAEARGGVGPRVVMREDKRSRGRVVGDRGDLIASRVERRRRHEAGATAHVALADVDAHHTHLHSNVSHRSNGTGAQSRRVHDPAHPTRSQPEGTAQRDAAT